VGFEFLPNFVFLSHNFDSIFIRMPIMSSKILDNSLLSKKKFESKHWLVGLVPRVRKTWSKRQKHAPIMASPTENPKSKTKKKISTYTRRFAESVEGLNTSSSIGW